jgi:hypothetical protein
MNAVNQREKQLAAIHESAHKHLVLSYGGLASAEIFKSKSVSPSDKFWIGECNIYSRPIAGSPATGPGATQPAPADWNVRVGLAGFIAEQMHEGQDDPAVILEEYGFARGNGEISNTDLELIGEEAFDEGDVEAIMQELRVQWESILTSALRLVNSTPD